MAAMRKLDAAKPNAPTRLMAISIGIEFAIS
jgi:hypothetical protein